jgi:tetratricopeptide (TPR) repeat protein
MTFGQDKKQKNEKKATNISLLGLKIVILPRILHKQKIKRHTIMTKEKNTPEVQPEAKKSGKTIQLGTMKVNKTAAIAVLCTVLAAALFVCVKFLYLDPKSDKAQTMMAKSLNQKVELEQQLYAALQAVQMAEQAITNPQDSSKVGSPDSLKAQVEAYKKVSADVYNKALKGDGKNPGLLKIAEESSTAAGNIACAEAGICYFKMGHYKEAIKYLEKFSPKGDKGLSPQYIAALANSYAADNQLDKAVEAFKKAAKEASNPAFSPVYLQEAGKLLESQNKNEEALALYEQIKSEYPTSSLVTSQQIEQLITRVSK